MYRRFNQSLRTASVFNRCASTKASIFTPVINGWNTHRKLAVGLLPQFEKINNNGCLQPDGSTHNGDLLTNLPRKLIYSNRDLYWNFRWIFVLLATGGYITSKWIKYKDQMTNSEIKRNTISTIGLSLGASSVVQYFYPALVYTTIIFGPFWLVACGGIFATSFAVDYLMRKFNN